MLLGFILAKFILCFRQHKAEKYVLLIYDYVHTTRNTFKRENSNMNNTEIVFYSVKLYLSIDIYMNICRYTSKVMEIHLKYFVFFPCS